MSALNTFYISYKSNAKEVIKDNKEVEKSTKNITKSVQDANEESKKFGDGFSKAIDGIANATAAWAGFNIIKSGITSAADYNTQLTRIGQNLQQNAQQLKAFGVVAQSVGGSAQGALSEYYARQNIRVNAGQNPISPQDELKAVRDRIKNSGWNSSQKQRFLNNIGFNDIGTRYLASQASDSEFNTYYKNASATSQLSPADQAAAVERTRTNALRGAAEDKAATQAGTKILPITNAANEALSKSPWLAWAAHIGTDILGIKAIGSLAKWGVGLFTGGAAIAGGASAAASGASLIGIGTAAAVTTGVVAAGAAAGGALGAGAYYGLGYFHKGIENYLAKALYKPVSPLEEGSLAKSLKSGNSGLDFWMSKGYSLEQASAIMANVQHESKGDPGAIGDGGSAKGLFQWHSKRRKDIMSATGIDINNAGYSDQLKAAAWEMKNGDTGFDDAHFRSIKDPAKAAAYFSSYFERPADKTGQALARGKTALGIASRYSNTFSGGNNGSVKIDKIEIVTQATDAKGIASSLKEELYSALGFLAANNDDGQSM